MKFVGVGLNHKTAPLSVREQISFPASSVAHAINDLKSIVEEAVILSTCNRTEIYSFASDVRILLTWLSRYQAVKIEDISPYVYILEDEAVAEHLYSVASGLDSMILGETQILGQIKRAVAEADQLKSLGTNMNYLFQSAFSVAKQVRTETSIGMNTVSMAAAALRLIRRIFPSIEDLKMLFIGAGEMIDIVATYFIPYKPKKVSIANRTLSRAKKLAEKFPECDSYSLIDLPYILHQYDAVISSTAAEDYVVNASMIKDSIRQRRCQSMFLLDLAVPRDFDVGIENFKEIFLYTVDDLESIVQEGKEARLASVEQAKTIISKQISQFEKWMSQRQKAPIISMMRSSAEQIRIQALEQASKQLAKGEKPEEVFETLSRQLVSKLLHLPTQMIKESDDLSQFLERFIK